MCKRLRLLLCMKAAKALVSLHISTDSSEHPLFDNVKEPKSHVLARFYAERQQQSSGLACP